MTKVYVLPAEEDWIVDRMTKEWESWNPDMSTRDIDSADVIWLLAGWRWRALSQDVLSRKRTIVTVHHVVPEKFSGQEFFERDRCVSEYLTYGEDTAEFLRYVTKKPITVLPYWANGHVFRRTMTVNEAKRLVDQKLLATHTVGSFQRDTEGSDGVSPKLEKGPDLLVEYVSYLKSSGKDVHVLLAGWRRQYVMGRLDQLGIPHTYVHRPPMQTINVLYQACDLYVVSSRREGGPQALIECGLTSTPVVSRDVGIARKVLNARSINNDLRMADASIPDVSSMMIPGGFVPYRRYFDR